MNKKVLFFLFFATTLYGVGDPESCMDKVLLGFQKCYTYGTILAIQSARHPFDVGGNIRRTRELYGGIHWDGRIAYIDNPAYFEANGMPIPRGKK